MVSFVDGADARIFCLIPKQVQLQNLGSRCDLLGQLKGFHHQTLLLQGFCGQLFLGISFLQRNCNNFVFHITFKTAKFISLNKDSWLHKFNSPESLATSYNFSDHHIGQ